MPVDNGNDDAYYAGQGSVIQWDGIYEWYDPADTYYTYEAQFTATGSFTQRNLGIDITIPYIYRYKRSSHFNNPMMQLHPSKNPVSFLFGSNVGDIANKAETASMGNNLDLYNAQGNALGSFSEERVLVYTSHGKAKIFAKGAAAGIEMGAELEAGISVVQKVASITAHSYNLNFRLQMNNLDNPTSAIPPNHYYTLYAYNQGIQRD